ncbi:type IV pilin protein [Microbulbifer sp. 2201CG32-9]|uniref:type IV pilin protein n=1 Tax=Microbulbifer sp. 2201CG32-9 TaxID=3232309 RepID=UPI00345BE587
MKQRGFTLIELMIAVAIVAILAAVAWPSYQAQVRATNRADAQGALLGLAQAMERHFTQNGSYKGAAAGNKDDGAPAIFPTQSPLDSGNKTYNLKIDVSDAGDTYTLLAEPIGSQAGTGNLSLKSSGEKAWDRNLNNKFDAGELCWDKVCN